MTRAASLSGAVAVAVAVAGGCGRGSLQGNADGGGGGGVLPLPGWRSYRLLHPPDDRRSGAGRRRSTSAGRDARGQACFGFRIDW